MSDLFNRYYPAFSDSYGGGQLGIGPITVSLTPAAQSSAVLVSVSRTLGTQMSSNVTHMSDVTDQNGEVTFQRIEFLPTSFDELDITHTHRFEIKISSSGAVDKTYELTLVVPGDGNT